MFNYCTPLNYVCDFYRIQVIVATNKFEFCDTRHMTIDHSIRLLRKSICENTISQKKYKNCTRSKPIQRADTQSIWNLQFQVWNPTFLIYFISIFEFHHVNDWKRQCSESVFRMCIHLDETNRFLHLNNRKITRKIRCG